MIDQGTLYIYPENVRVRAGEVTSRNAKKVIPIVYNMKLAKVHPKEYKSVGIVYNFLLEELFDYGPASIAKFGSADKPQAEEFWMRLNAEIKAKRVEVSDHLSFFLFARMIIR